jgi:crotonobetainyl-CoA:carnitine CoA-transferase CaiB-like acyl-CoA transferase
LLVTSDVVLQNFKGGSLERLGLGAEAVTRNFPRLVYCAISGYGDDGPQFPALDTVIQAKAGLTSLIGNGEQPLRVGVSVADFLSGNFAAFGILAALEERRRSGRGQIVDISMYDAAAWLTQLAWPDGRSAIGPWTVIEGSDGWVAADATLVQARAALAAVEHRDLSTDALASRLQRAVISGARVLELDEVVNQRAHRARQTLYRAPTAEGEGIPILSLPFGLQATPPLRSVHVAALGADNGILARTGLPASPPAGSRDGDATKRAPRS